MGEPAPIERLGQRFVVRHALGAGAMGTVYRVFDNQRRAEVALKTLRRFDSATLARFKREFRSLAGLVHPNLVTLYELGSIDDVWFLTMELVEGCDFLEFVRPYRKAVEASPPTHPERTYSGTPAPSYEDTAATLATPIPGGPLTSALGASLRVRQAIFDARLDESRLRAAFVQLTQGLVALHDAGKLHCDLKPTNVLVSRAGRALLCDFGLVADLRADARGVAQDIVGTPAYMSPEQALGEPLTEATDWYGAGVMLHEALSGHRPFEGVTSEVLRGKQERDAPPLLQLAQGVPADLAELCDALLARDPRRRPHGREVLARLGARGTSSPPIVDAREERDAPFVGRGAQLDELTRAFADARTGCVPTLLAGLSGMGKTALARTFLTQLQEDPRVLVLAGRCYERESVPFKALDALVDSLGAHLAALPISERSALVRDEARALARLFPAFARLEARAEGQEDEPGDAQQLRQRAFDALTHILARLGRARPTVLFIDDLHWGDLDSAPFFAGLVHGEGATPVMLLVTYRSDEQSTSPLLRALLDVDAATSIAASARTILVESLAEPEARALAAAIVPAQAGNDASLALMLAESGGHPFFLTELARVAGSGARRPDGAPLALDTLLQQRVRALPDAARALMITTALVGRPMPISLLAQAAEVHDEPAAAAALLAQRLVRGRRREGVEELEPYHDRIRVAAVAMLAPDEARGHHARIARTLEAHPGMDPLPLVEHWLAAGERAKAGGYAALAAARAEGALAFASAARLYRQHLELSELDGEARRAVHVKLGDALSNAGALIDAAVAFRDAAEGAPVGMAINLRARAAGELIRSGKLDEGLTLAQRVLHEVGLPFPRRRLRILGGLILRRLWLALVGTSFRDRAPEGWSARLTHRIDACQAVAGGLSFVLPTHGAYFHTRQLLWARRLGDPRRFALALNLEVGFRSLAGASARPSVKLIVTQIAELGARVSSPGVAGFSVGGNGLSAFLAGDFEIALRDCFAGAALLRFDAPSIESGPDLRWQRRVFELYGLAAALYLGQLRRVIEEVPQRLRLALESGDEYIAKALRAWRTNLIWLALDDPDTAQRQALAGAPPPVSDTFTIQHYYQMLTRGQLDLYRGDAEHAFTETEVAWAALRRTMHLRLQSVRVEGWFLRARCALAAAQGAPSARARGERLAVARTAARALERERVPWATALAQLVRATLAHAEGHAEARALLLTAARRCDEAKLAMHASVARRQLAATYDADSAGVAREDAWMRSAGVRSPGRFARLYAPGWPE